jgi:hypothetical protein
MVRVSGPSRLPGACAVRAWTVSPSAGANAAMYTSALTFGLPVAAFVITKPP